MRAVAAAILLALFGCILAASPRCPTFKFDCRNGACISGSLWCNGDDDCGNAADELSCGMCLGGSLRCASDTRCIPALARCDGVQDCADGSDEDDARCTGAHGARPKDISTLNKQAAQEGQSITGAAAASGACARVAVACLLWPVFV